MGGMNIGRGIARERQDEVPAVGVTDHNKVANVDITSPPITARPNGASIWLPFSNANAIGIIPTVIAHAVIKIGRKRWLAPRIADSVDGLPCFQ